MSDKGVSGEGRVKAINEPRGYGFIRKVGQTDIKDVFFHCNALAGGLEFDEQLVERRVWFTEVETDKGPRAVEVRPAE